MEQANHKRYRREFMERAIALSEEIGCTRTGRILGIRAGRLTRWVRDKKHGKATMKRKESPEAKAAVLANREIQKLKQENADLKKANFILKEIASVFSKDPLSSSLGRSLNSTNKKKNK